MKLLTIPFSHFCEKARWALDLSHQKYTEEAHLPVFHYFNNKLKGAGNTVPALIAGDQILNDSTDILVYLDQTHQLGLYPSENAEAVSHWESRFDRVFGIEARRWAYARLLKNDRLFLELLKGFKHPEVLVAKPSLSLIKSLIRQKSKISAGSVAYSIRELRRLWDELDQHFSQAQYMVGEQFTAADLTLASLGGVMVFPKEYGYPFPPLAHFPEFMQEEVLGFRETPTGQAILRIYAEHRWK